MLTVFGFNGANGTTATTANIGATQITANAGSTITLASSAAVHGATGLLISSNASVTCIARFAFASAGPQVQVTVEVLLPSSAPSGSIALFSLRHSSGRVMSVGINSTTHIFVQDSANTYTTVNGTALTWGNKYRISLVVTGASTTAGVIVTKIYNSGGTSALYTNTVSNANLTANNISQIELGATNAYAATFGIDDLQLNDGAGSEIPAYVPVNNTPSLSLSANQNVSAGATVAIAATAADTDGSIVSYAWTYLYPVTGGPNLTGASTANVSFTAGAAGSLYILQCVVTDDGGTSVTATSEVRVPVSGSTTQAPIADNGTGSVWSNVGGAATQGQALSDGSDTTYVESPTVSSTETAHRWRWQPSNAKSTAQITLRLGTDTGTATVAVRLFEGTTSRQTWSQAVTATATDYNFTLSGGTIGAITDWSNLFVEVGATS